MLKYMLFFSEEKQIFAASDRRGEKEGGGKHAFFILYSLGPSKEGQYCDWRQLTLYPSVCAVMEGIYFFFPQLKIQFSDACVQLCMYRNTNWHVLRYG